MCAPELLPLGDRRAELSDAYDVRLALASAGAGADAVVTIVTNPIAFDHGRGRVWVLTGPNHGGKTTYTRAVGVAQVLFQAGLYAPASSARLSPVDTILTHFPAREDARLGQGRLDAEAERLAAIFRAASRHSLILLNEALAGTSALEALDLARGVVRALRLLGARAIYVTHLHELATAVDDINATTPGDGTVASLVAAPGEPQQCAHAPVPHPARPTRGHQLRRRDRRTARHRYEQLSRLVQRNLNSELRTQLFLISGFTPHRDRLDSGYPIRKRRPICGDELRSS